MIPFDDTDIRALCQAFDWFDALTQKPVGIASLNDKKEQALHFVSGATGKLDFPRGAVVLVKSGENSARFHCIEVDDPRRAFALLSQKVRDVRAVDDMRRLDNGALISNRAAIHPSSRIESGAVIGHNVSIGEMCIVEPGAVVRPQVAIGNRCRILSNAVVGGEGFGYAMSPGNNAEPIAHLGGVKLSDDVDVGTGAFVSAGTIDPTNVGRGTKIEGNVYIGHNAQIGERTMICANAVVGGSVVVGDDVWINPSASIKTKVSVGDRAVVGMGATVMRTVPSEQTVMGDPASEIRQRLRRNAAIDRLVEVPKNLGS